MADDEKINTELLQALVDYGMAIKKQGGHAGDTIILRYEKQFSYFRELAGALGIVLRAFEITDEKS